MPTDPNRFSPIVNRRSARLFVTGATGLIGRRLVVDRLERGDQVVLLSRDAERAAKMFAANANRNITIVAGNPAAPGNWQEAVAGCDAVIHLAAAGIADRRWTSGYKKLIVSSRVDSTHQIVNAIESAPPESRPRILINGSAAGYYGDQGDTELDEGAPPGNDYLARLCMQWETQALRAESMGVRVVLSRTGVVLDERGGMVRKMYSIFRFGLGGPLGSGRQFLPWIHWRDLVGLVDLALREPELRGPLNAVAPQGVRQRGFAKALGRVWNRPSFLPAPRFALRLALGEVADVLIASQRVVPARARQFGYQFFYPDLEKALEDLIATSPEGDMQLTDEVTAKVGDRPIVKSTDAMPEAPIRLLAIDIDGTLLCSDGSISHGVVQACRAAERAGCVIVPATVRPPRGLKSIIQALDITSPSINYNGAVIWNPIDQKAQFHEPLPSELSRQIVNDALAIEPNLVVSLEVLDRWYVNRLDPAIMPVDEVAYEPDSVGDLDQILSTPASRIDLLAGPDQLRLVLEMIRARYWQSRHVSVFLSDPRVIQITHPLVDKGIALQRIAKRMELRREEVMAIGDGLNDMGMIEWAGFGVAVENALPAVRDLADAVVASNDDQGVARAIQRYVLGKR